MGKQESIPRVNRRKFITTVMPACGLSCLGVGNLAGICGSASADQEEPMVHKFQKNWCKTHEEAFEWRFGYYIEYMEQFAKYLGRDELVQMIKRAVDDSLPPAKVGDPDFSLRRWIQGGNDMYANMMTWEVIEQTDTVYEMRVSECLWCKIFQKHNAADIGYASVCYSDFAYARSVHPKLSMKHTKTLMNGDGYCNHRWIFEG
ncbi:MAG TPA: L-2-amino-thiazoline-4-carboxylic acid hydrolase [Acidobacteriota bacterium]|nr:L-2-amino-thiazoline-4-carboxylic acid hydrolase [Acidobacteriota bacterium]